MTPEEIKKLQVHRMKVPPEPDRFYLDLGFYLLYSLRVKPKVELVLVDCEFLGLAEIHEKYMSVIILARFEGEDGEENITCKGYLLTKLHGDELYSHLPEKGEAMDLKICMDAPYCVLEGDELVATPMQGRFKEQFLPLWIQDFLD